MKIKRPEARIKPLEMRHAPFIQRYASDPAIAATTYVPHPLPENFGEELVRRAIRDRAEGSSSFYAVYNEETFVGLCGVGIDEKERPWLFYWIGKPFWGRGFGYAAARAVLTRVFSERGYPIIMSHSLTHNPASIRILEKCGFQPDGEEEVARGTVAYFILKKDDFKRAAQMEESKDG